MKKTAITCMTAALLAMSAWSAEGDKFLDLGGMASIYDDAHELGRGGYIGYLWGTNDDTDMGVRLRYAHFPKKIALASEFNVTGVDFVTYYTPYYGDIRPRLGAHVGYSYDDFLEASYVDLGGTLMGLNQINDMWRLFFYFNPSILIGGDDTQMHWRLGFGVNYRVGG